MAFPWHDAFWSATARFVLDHAAPEERVLAPDIFWPVLPRLQRYAGLREGSPGPLDWAVIHKGDTGAFPPGVLQALLDGMKPVFANEVFVVLALAPGLAGISRDSDHVKALVLLAEAQRLEGGTSPVNQAPEPVLPDASELVQFRTLDRGQLRDAMNRFYRQGGYEYETLRDRTYYAEIDRHIREMAGAPSGRQVLDLCCGPGRLAQVLRGDRVMGVDLSDEIVETARARHAGIEGFGFRQMDVHELTFGDGEFDLVLFVDAIEHVHDAALVMKEAARVLRPGGRLMVTVANRDSLNQFITRKLGHPEFVTNYQHIREFSYRETLGLVHGAGLETERTAGVYLFPYWGVPGIDQYVRELTDNDPETVELMRVLGERAGAEYAYLSVVLARKPGGHDGR